MTLLLPYILPIVILVNFVLSVIILSRGLKDRINILFGLLALGVALWSFAILGFYFIELPTDLKSLWIILTHLSAAFIALIFLYFSLYFPYLLFKNKYIIFLPLFFLAIIIYFLFFSNIIIGDVFNGIYEINFGYIFYSLYIILCFFVGYIFLFLQYRKSRELIQKIQIKYVLIGAIFSSLLATITDLIFPFLNIFHYTWLGPIFTLLLVIATAIAILKHHLFNIKVIATELLVFVIWIAILFELIIEETLKQRLFVGGLFIFTIIAGISLIRSVLKEVHQREQMEKLSKELEKLNSQLSIRTQQLTSLKDFTTSLIKTLDFKEIIQIIVDGIVERFNYAGVFLTGITDDGKYLYPLAISQNKPVELALKLLPKKLEDYREPIENNQSLAAQTIQTNSIQINEDFGKFFSAVPSIILKGMQALIGFKSVLAIPVISKDKVMGVLNVALLKGEKEIGIAELELLNTIANQIAIVLTNAKLFQQIEEANAKLIELDKAKAGMYSFVSHQIKAPIGIVKGFAQLLLDDSYGKLPKKAKERVEDMKKSCDRLIQLVNDFLDLRRIEEGRMEFEFKEINLVDLVKSVFEELRFLAEQKKLEFTLECAEKEMKIKADEQRMRQVIQNLIENSIKYTEKGFVRVKCQLSNVNGENSILIEVSDSGMGIKPDVLPQLFDQFKRAKEAKLIQGTGLGLYIAREIVKAHKGEIWAESDGEGKGSRFFVKLAVGE